MPIFMKIDGIDGESSNERYRGWMDVYSFSWGESNSAGTGGGGGAGKVQFQDFTFTKPTGKGSPRLMLACANGAHFRSLEVAVTQAQSESEQVYQKYILTDCTITSHQVSGDGGSLPAEQVSFNFAKIEFTQNVYDGQGRLVESQMNFWDRRTGRGG